MVADMPADDFAPGGGMPDMGGMGGMTGNRHPVQYRWDSGNMAFVLPILRLAELDLTQA